MVKAVRGSWGSFWFFGRGFGMFNGGVLGVVSSSCGKFSSSWACSGAGVVESGFWCLGLHALAPE